MAVVDIFTTDKKYNVIYADPPWQFSSKEVQRYNGNRFRPLETVYGTEKASVMETWDVKRIAEKDAALFMWSTDAHLEEAIRLMKAWGVQVCDSGFRLVKKDQERQASVYAWGMDNEELRTLPAWDEGRDAQEQTIQFCTPVSRSRKNRTQQEARLRQNPHHGIVWRYTPHRTVCQTASGRLGLLGERSGGRSKWML